MKITRVEIADFRAYAGPAEYVFELGGNNLLMYGENGSGKSSFCRALVEFFNLDPRAKPFAEYRNIFTDPATTTGHITVHFDDGSSAAWSNASDRPVSAPQIAALAIRTGWIDYRAMLRTHFAQVGDMVNLFEVAVDSLLVHYPITTTAGSRTTIGGLWRRVLQNKPRNHHGVNLRRAIGAVGDFNRALQDVLPILTRKVQELMPEFPSCPFEVQLSFPGVTYDERARVYASKELNLSIILQGRAVPHHQHFLNEARLSALALAIYFAGLLVSVPDPPPGAPDARLLMLDDVLIGLDMSNRVPVFRVLQRYFGNWQIVLLTHDKWWYDFVRLGSLPEDGWHSSKLLCAPSVGGWDVPIYVGENEGWPSLISDARRHLAGGDLNAAVTYIRSAFEHRIKKYCEDKRLAVRYSTDPHKMKSEWFWKAIKDKAGSDGTVATYERIFANIEAYRATVMNPLSHDGAVPVTRAEIEGAINAVDALAALR
jgi:hypothetical protein